MTAAGRSLFGSEARGGPVSVCIPADDPSRVGEIRRAATSLAEAQGLDDTDRGRVALVATEAATNAARHAKGGIVLLRALGAEDGPGVEVLAVDRGPGLANPGRALEDGYSTGGTAGKGLGGMRRVASEFDFFSTVGRGSVLFARIRAADAPPPTGTLDVGVVCVPAPGEMACGDGWSVDQQGGGVTACVVDGLGHGPAAATAAEAALAEYRRAGAGRPPAEVLQRIHEALRATRGAAVALVRYDRAGRALRYAGVGNIAGSVAQADGSRGMASANGTVGLQIRTIHEYDYGWPAGALLVIHTDGLSARWKLDDYPGLFARPAATVAAVLHRDFTRGRDDATVVVLRDRR